VDARRTSAMASAFMADSMVPAILGSRPSSGNASVFSRSLWTNNSRCFLRGGGSVNIPDSILRQIGDSLQGHPRMALGAGTERAVRPSESGTATNSVIRPGDQNAENTSARNLFCLCLDLGPALSCSFRNFRPAGRGHSAFLHAREFAAGGISQRFRSSMQTAQSVLQSLHGLSRHVMLEASTTGEPELRRAPSPWRKGPGNSLDRGGS